MNRTAVVAAMAAGIAIGAFADFRIDIDLDAKPIKDMGKTANGVAMGVNGAMEAWLSGVSGNDDILFVSNKVETARVFREAGLRVMRLQGMNSWFGGRPIPDYASPYDTPRLEVGSMGVLYRLFTEAIMDHPLFLAHGTSKARDTEDAFFTSARVTDQVYRRRRALIEGASGKKAPAVEGEVEWVAAHGSGELCLLMVNTKGTPETARVTVKGKLFFAPVYRTLSCPEEFIDCRAIPGDGPVWRQTSWEDTQFGVSHIPMEMYNGINPKCDVLTVTIAPHTVQTVTVPLANPR